MKRISILSALIALAGCAGQSSYVLPTAQPSRDSSSRLIDRPRDEVWAAAVPSLSKNFFVINNMDKASGFINLSYSGDPEKYVDCGRVTSDVKNLAGARSYDFPASRAFQQYETMDTRFGLQRFARRMALEGRVNLVFEAVSANQTRVTASVRYVLARNISVYNATNQLLGTLNHSISFNSGQIEAYPPANDGQATTCLSTGQLERELLAAVQ